MYTYYFLMEIKMMPKWFNPMWITIAQINQMFVGVGVTVAAFIYHREGNCEGVVDWLLPYCCFMYATYLYFFVEVSNCFWSSLSCFNCRGPGSK